MNLSLAWRHVRVTRELDSGDTTSARSATLAVVTALCLAAGGLAVAIYFFSIHAFSMGRANTSEVRAVLAADNGLIDQSSHHSVEQTVDRLQQLLRSKGITVFALIDHSGEASKVGMTMPSTKLLIFGNPKAGTPLMLAAPTVAIDLPLKVLVWEDKDGKVWVSYNDPNYLKDRHRLPQDLLQNIAGVATLVATATAAAAE